MLEIHNIQELLMQFSGLSLSGDASNKPILKADNNKEYATLWQVSLA